MFHTFQSAIGLQSSAVDTDGSGKPSRLTGSRRISTSNACAECRRRKIRCDGSQPCGQCQWYQHPEACTYSKPAQRVVPSRKLVDKLSNNIELYKNILTKLYGVTDVESLAVLPREELLELAQSTPPSDSVSCSSATAIRALSEHSDELENTNLHGLQSLRGSSHDEMREHQSRMQGIPEDISDLSMSADPHCSYVGISSVSAALKVIARCAPQAYSLVTLNTAESIVSNRVGNMVPELADDNPHALPHPDHGQELLESYFDRVHPFFPMVDERKFWSTYIYSNRKDSAWLGLLNMLFACGSLASMAPNNEIHHVYFNRSRQHLSLESFGSRSLEVLQTLAIMSGYYMHFLNRPNEAHSLMGGTLRMATAMGLHREFSERSDGERQDGMPTEEDAVSPELRRRIWWSLSCLDAWASTTTGRSSLGSRGPAITVLRPGTAENTIQDIPPPNNPQYIEQLKILPLIHASSFCQIVLKIQDRLVESPLLPPTETATHDAHIMKWFRELPSILSDPEEPCPEFFRRVRLIMKWRFQNIRIVLHRPILLINALRGNTWNTLSTEEKLAVRKCRMAACETIEEITEECMLDLVSVWNAVWFCFQACMVPLVSLFSDASVPEETEKWKTSIETALQFFESVQEWGTSAKRSGEMIWRLYAAYKSRAAGLSTSPQYQDQSNLQPPSTADSSITPNSNPEFGQDQGAFHYNPATPTWPNVNNNPAILNNFWDGMMWETSSPDMMEAAFGQCGDYGYVAPPQASSSGNAFWMHGD